MTVRIAQNLGLDKVVNFSKELGIYESRQIIINITWFC